MYYVRYMYSNTDLISLQPFVTYFLMGILKTNVFEIVRKHCSESIPFVTTSIVGILIFI